MTALNKQALRSKARSASAGEWIKESGDGWEAICSTNDQANGNFIIAHFEGPDALANREFVQAANPATVLALLDELEAKDKRIEEEIFRANREHHRGFMMACNHLKEHANIHYADAAEMEIAALRQRMAELEARTVKLPTSTEVNGFQMLIEEEVIARLRESGVNPIVVRAAGIGVKGE